MYNMTYNLQLADDYTKILSPYNNSAMLYYYRHNASTLHALVFTK